MAKQSMIFNILGSRTAACALTILALLSACGRSPDALKANSTPSGDEAPRSFKGSTVSVLPLSSDDSAVGSSTDLASEAKVVRRPSTVRPNQAVASTPSSQQPDKSTENKDLSKAQRYALEQKMTIFEEKRGVLEPVEELPAKAIIEMTAHYTVINLPHRLENGSLAHSSTGFVSPVQVVSVPGLKDERLDQLNSIKGGLFISATIVQVIEGSTGYFTPMRPAPAIGDFLKLFEANGQPRFEYPRGLKKRFSKRLNLAVSDLSETDKKKYEKIFSELTRAVSREKATLRALMYTSRFTALFHSREFERSGLIPIKGAWSIAVEATAVRHGFANVPCAEFASETIRQAYRRAGFNVTDDFNSSKGNSLIWKETASVFGLSRALYKAGWVVWSAREYKPPVGAVMLNGIGNSPGHVYFAAGSDGRWIVDNGSPHGRDLMRTNLRYLNMLYRTGGFILPPGITPEKWPDNPNSSQASPDDEDDDTEED